MTTTALPADIFSAAALHLDVLDEFIAIARDKLAQTDNAFARDSLTDLLTNLTDQRETYLALAAPMTTATA